MGWFHRLRNLVRSESISRDIDREIDFHIAEKADALRAAGMSDDDARREATRLFGNRGIQAERTRDADIIGWLDTMRGDVRHALRGLGRTPVFTIVAVASLALGIGANTGIYTLIDALVLRPLPVPHPEELVQVTFGGDDPNAYFTNPLWEQLRDRRTGFTALAAFGESSLNRAEGGEARRVLATWVSGEYFSVFDLPPAAGRLIGPSDDVRGCPPIAVLGHGMWRSEFGASPDAIGQTISLEGRRFEIVGVVAREFGGAEVGAESQLYLPLCARAVIDGTKMLDTRDWWWLRVIGRREPHLPLAQVVRRLEAIAPAAHAATVPPDWPADMQASYRERTLGATSAERGVSGLREMYSSALIALMGAVAIVLLIACANVANLLLARAASREREVAIRMAIGAGRGRLVRQHMSESLLLAALGALAGLVVAQWGTRALVALISPSPSAVSLDLSLDPRVLGFTALVAALTAILFGLAPSWRATRVSPQTAMSARGRGIAEGHARFTAGKALVAAQVALSLVLLIGAGLLIGSLRNLATLDPGFRSDGIVIVSVNLSRTGSEALRAAMRDQLLERVRAIPGVRSAAMSQLTPIGPGAWNGQVVAEEAPGGAQEPITIWFNEVSDGWFATLDIDLLAGRDFGPEDVRGAPATAIINASAARKLFGNASPLGRRILRTGGIPGDPVTVVGVVEDAKYRSLRETNSATIYLPASQADAPGVAPRLVVRADAMDAVIAGVKRAAAEVHPLTSLDIRTLSQTVAGSLRRERMLAILSTVFAAVALMLSLLGLYGVMAYAVARRRNEIGVRIALGADRPRVLRLVLGDVGRVVSIGLVLGAVGTLGLGRVVESFLYGLEPTEPRILALAVALLATVGAIAGLVPALRATRVDPVAALREE